MESENKSPKSTSSPRSNEELASFHPLNRGAVDSVGIVDHVVYPAPYFSTVGMYGVPRPYEQDMLYFPVTENDVSQFNVADCPETGYDYFYEPVTDFQSLAENVNEFGQYNALGALEVAADIHANDLGNSQVARNIVTTGYHMTGGLQRASEEADGNDICEPWLVGNQGSYAGSVPVSGHNSTTRDSGMNSSQLCGAGGDESGSRHPVIGNQFIHPGTIPVLGRSRSSGELGMNNNIMEHAAQSNHPEILDGKFLTLGIETRSEPKVSSKDSNQSTKRIVHPTLNTSSGQNIDSLNSSSDMASGFSTFQNYTGGFSRLALNQSLPQTQNLDGFSSLGHNADGISYHARNVNRFPSLGVNVGGVSHHAMNVNRCSSLVQNPGGFFSPMQNVGGFFHQAQNIDRSSGLVQNMGGFFHQAQNIDRSSGVVQNMGGFSVPSSNATAPILSPLVDTQNFHIPCRGNSGLGEERVGRLGNIDPYTNFQGFPTNSSVPHISNEVKIHNVARFRATGMPSLSSNEVQNPNIGAVWNFSSGPSAVPPSVGVRSNRARQVHSGQHANKVSAALAAEGGPLSKNVGVQPASKGNHGIPQASVSVDPSKTFGQDIPSVNGPTQFSSISLGTSRKRAATTSPSDAPKGRRTKTRLTKPSSCLSTTALAQTGLPDAPLASFNTLSPRMPHTVRTRPPLPHNSHSLPFLSRTSPLHHVKYQAKDRETLEPSGNKCYICNRDLSFTPEGPIEETDKPIPSAVLPCGHHFHDSCLQRITPENQALHPPCIPCALADKDQLSS